MPEDLRHIIVRVPDDWTSTAKGQFFERFIGELIASMRFHVVKQLRLTGMEIDLLAQSLDEPRTILVECKAYKDALPADAITKLLGNVQIRRADAGWLFSTSELTKDGAGLWHEIQQDDRNKRLFAWFGPEKIIEILLHQSAIVRPAMQSLAGMKWEVGDPTLVITPTKRHWLVQLLQDGLPKLFTAFDATDGRALTRKEAQEGAAMAGLTSSLQFYPASTVSPLDASTAMTYSVPVARVTSGDRWDDPRPAQPADFVGRADIIEDISSFLAQARTQHTPTRNFAVTGPSGWGKSSLALKLVDLAARGEIAKCSISAIDTRSAADSSFVIESIRQTFQDARSVGLISKSNKLRISNINHPLDSPDIVSAVGELSEKNGLVVLVLDQFEELFVKEPLFGVFESVRALSLELDARCVPFVLGFSWKTDISLPQQHPAYHLWHELNDRRRAFSLKEFGKTEILRILHRAGKAAGKPLAPALKDRLVEQCQGLPWLLKKLAVHILTRVSANDSQYALLERQLDIEDLFKRDLASLAKEQIACLMYVARNSPASISVVEETYSSQIANQLIHAKLLIRSGMNYSVYWDIFRDYLTQKRVPEIPWARTFWTSPAPAMRILSAVARLGAGSVSQIAAEAGSKEGPCANVLSDLVALQLVDRRATDSYGLAGHIAHPTNITIAIHVERQLRRHIVYQKTVSSLEKARVLSAEEWTQLFLSAQPPSMGWKEKTQRYYADSLRRWLIFAGLLEARESGFSRSDGAGKQKGIVLNSRRGGRFLGTSTPSALLDVLRRIAESPKGVRVDALVAAGLRNAVTDAIALGLVRRTKDGKIVTEDVLANERDVSRAAKRLVLEQSTIAIVASQVTGEKLDTRQVGDKLRSSLKARWTEASAKRYANGLYGFFRWASGREKPGKNPDVGSR